MKKLLSVICISLATILCLTSCSGYRSIDNIKKSGKLVMYTYAEFAPFEYMVGQNVAGVDVDIANEIAKELGVKLDIQNVKFETIISAIKTGKGDIGLAGISITPERQKNVSFSTDYTTSTQYVITKNGTTIDSIKDLAGKKVGVQTGTTGDFLMSDAIDGYTNDDNQPEKGEIQGTNASIERFNSALLAALDLLNGRIDAVVVDKLPAENIVKSNSGLSTKEIKQGDGANISESYAVAVTKGNQDLIKVINKVIDNLTKSGKIDEFIVKHSTEATNK